MERPSGIAVVWASWLTELYADEAVSEREPGWPCEGSDAELPDPRAEARSPDARLWASISALRLSDEIWVLLNPDTVVDGAGDELELSSRSKPPAGGCDEACCGEVSDWTASSASEAPMAGSMIRLRKGLVGKSPSERSASAVPWRKA